MPVGEAIRELLVPVIVELLEAPVIVELLVVPVIVDVVGDS